MCRVPRGHPLLHSVKANEKPLLQVRTAGDVAVVHHMELTPDYEEPDYRPKGATVFLSTEEKTDALHAYHFDAPVQAAFLKYHVRIAKTTTATQLAVKDGPKKPLEELIPTKFMKYRKVFDETSAQRLPEHCSWDHAIELKPGSKRKDCGIYCLTPDEMKALKEFLDEHLKRGTIRCSAAPVASPFFFIQKKGGSLRPVQDY